MDPQILPINTPSSSDNQDKSDYNNKSILLTTTTNKKQLVLLKPNNNANNKMYCVLRPEDLQLRLPSPVKVPPKPGRPKRIHNEDEPIDLPENKVEIEEIPRKVFRTRSGRVTKPPRYINEETNNKPEHQIIEAPIIQTEIKDNKLPNIKLEQKRNISAQYRCETCKKAYLGRAKMLKHLQLNADHVAPKFFQNDKKRPDLWTDLINKTKNVPKDEQVRFIYDEFVSFIRKAREVLPKLLKSENDAKNHCISVDSQFSNALGIPEGFYSVIEQNVADVLNNIKENNKTTLENKTATQQQQQQQNEEKFVQEITNSDVQIQNTDQNSLLNLLDTGQVSFDNSNSEEVMNVDQLIHERLKSLTGGELETNSASQNLHLDLSLDMFPYHTNNL